MRIMKLSRFVLAITALCLVLPHSASAGTRLGLHAVDLTTADSNAVHKVGFYGRYYYNNYYYPVYPRVVYRPYVRYNYYRVNRYYSPYYVRRVYRSGCYSPCGRYYYRAYRRCW